MMKKFMNAPETVTDEELVGLGLAFSDIVEVDGHLVISKDLKDADRVTIVTYGGSGHEPAQAGYVGKGMLDVQAVGDIFAAPSGQLVFEAMKLADKGHGVLLLTLNYAGDQLAGKQAMKLAKKAGLNFRQVVTGEEIQFDPNGEDNKRGLAGAIALYHIAQYYFLIQAIEPMSLIAIHEQFGESTPTEIGVHHLLHGIPLLAIHPLLAE